MNGASLVAAAVVLAVSVPARATPPVKLAYDAPPECPSESELVAAVTARGADFDAPRAAPAPEIMVVSVALAQDGFAGAFQVRDDGDATNKREVHGADCREVTDALAVVTAIALQGDASAGSGDAPAARASPPAAPAAPPPATELPGSRRGGDPIPSRSDCRARDDDYDPVRGVSAGAPGRACISGNSSGISTRSSSSFRSSCCWPG